jgi:hypothetical protein
VQLTRDMLDSLRGTHANKRLHLATSIGLSGSVDIHGDRELPVTLLLDECERSFGKDARIAALLNEVIKLEARLLNAAECLISEADTMKEAAFEANRVSDPRPQ